MSPIDANRHLENTTLPVLGLSGNLVWWRWLIAVQLVRYGPAMCVCVGTVGVVLSLIVWIRLVRHLPATILYLLIALMLELLPVYMHCGSYTLKQVISTTLLRDWKKICRQLRTDGRVSLHALTPPTLSHRALLFRVSAGCLATLHACPRSVAAVGVTFCALGLKSVTDAPKRWLWGFHFLVFDL